jgi:hypothetical protein
MRSRLVAAGLLLGVVACSSSSSTTTGGTASSTVVRRGGPNLITFDEIQQLGNAAQNAFEIIERLRPTMMRARSSTLEGGGGGQSISPVAVVDEVPQGDLSNLKNISAVSVREIRYLSATDATQRWGTGYTSGAIQVITRR